MMVLESCELPLANSQLILTSCSVAQDGFGSGSSREDAVRALQGAGIIGVIAKGFAFICELVFFPLVPVIMYLTEETDDRNQLNMGLFNAIVTDDEFYQHATEGSTITVDKDQKVITICGVNKSFHYQSSWIEDTLLNAGGILPLYHLHGTSLFRHLTSSSTQSYATTTNSTPPPTDAFSGGYSPHSELAW
jgi:homoaconitate hydratase